jgi:hypothetical protein
MIQSDTNKSFLKKETLYLEQKEKIKKFLQENDTGNVIRCIVENLDSIPDLTLTQNVEMFRLVSSLEDAQHSYNKIFNVIQEDKTTQV